MIRNVCAHPAQLLNPTISIFRHSPYMVIITLYNSKINFYQLMIDIFGVRNPTNFFFFFFFEIGRKYVSIIVNTIINITVLQCYLLWLFVSIRRLVQLIACIGVSIHPLPSQKHHLFFFAKLPLKSANYSSCPFQAIHPQKLFFSCTS